MRVLPSSPRRRRRLARAGLVVLPLVVFGVLALFIRAPHRHETKVSGSGPISRPPPAVRVTPHMRREINVTLDRFVPAAVDRRDPMLAYRLSTPDMRAGATRKEWRHGSLPVYPYSPRGRQFHGWTLNYAIPNEVNFDLMLQPANPAEGAIVYTVDMKRMHDRWLVDSFFNTAQFRPVVQKNGSKVVGQHDFEPVQYPGSSQTGKSRATRLFAFAPLAVVGLGLALVFGFFLVGAVRNRLAERAYSRSRELPPLPPVSKRDEREHIGAGH